MTIDVISTRNSSYELFILFNDQKHGLSKVIISTREPENIFLTTNYLTINYIYLLLFLYKFFL